MTEFEQPSSGISNRCQSGIVSPEKARAASRRPSQGLNLSVRLEEEAALSREVEEVEQVVQCRRVQRRIGPRQLYRVREVIPTAVRHRLQAPVALDELENRDMGRVLVRDESPVAQRQVLRIRHDDQRDARAVAEEVHRLYVA